MEDSSAAALRWAKLRRLQAHYRDFVVFAEDVMEFLGFSLSDMQRDIAKFIDSGPDNLMVMAQRGEAKTTIAAIKAVHALIENPKCRVLIVSAGESLANDISTLVVRIILTMGQLECLRPDRQAGDRSSVTAFDVHHSLKGVEKTASVKSIGITANLAGNRADLLICDDVESPKNSLTAAMRATLLHFTREFSSIVVKGGRIVWLGTPQSSDSIYNTLPARGVTVRIWPGRYPTEAQEAAYGPHLAPYVRRYLEAHPEARRGGGMLGDQGLPTDPLLRDEDTLQEKERDQGAAHFQLQFMLLTQLLDKDRFPLKTEQLILLPLDQQARRVPLVVNRGVEKNKAAFVQSCDLPYTLMEPQSVSPEFGEIKQLIATIDPAGGGANADETAFAIGGECNSTLYLMSVGGVPGGYDLVHLEKLAQALARFPTLDLVVIEKNYGNGAFAAIFFPILRRYLPKVGLEEPNSKGRKEDRIIDGLGPVVGRGSLVITPGAIEDDHTYCQQYHAGVRSTYSLLHQFSKIRRQAGALLHDDRLDSVEMLAAKCLRSLRRDPQEDLERLRDEFARSDMERALAALGVRKAPQPSTFLQRYTHGSR